MHVLSNGENIFDLRWPLKVKGQGQTLKLYQIEVKRSQIGSYVWAFEWQKYFDLRWLLKVYGQGQTIEVKYLQNGMIWNSTINDL